MKMLGIILGMLCALYAEETISYKDTMHLDLSSHSPNRIVFPEKIISKTYRQEGQIELKNKGEELYVKWSPISKLTNEDDNATQPVTKLDYSMSSPEAVFIKTETQTYAFIFHPKDIGPKNIIITSLNGESSKAFTYETRDEYLPLISQIISLGFDAGADDSRYLKKNELSKIYKQEEPYFTAVNLDNLRLIPLKQYTGSTFFVICFSVKNISTKEIEVYEHMFHKSFKNSGYEFVAASLWRRGKLFPGEETLLSVIFKRGK